jgi:hypothetical protein
MQAAAAHLNAARAAAVPRARAVHVLGLVLNRHQPQPNHLVPENLDDVQRQTGSKLDEVLTLPSSLPQNSGAVSLHNTHASPCNKLE